MLEQESTIKMEKLKPMQCWLLILTFSSLLLKYLFSLLRLELCPFLKAGTITDDEENAES